MAKNNSQWKLENIFHIIKRNCEKHGKAVFLKKKNYLINKKKSKTVDSKLKRK